MTDNLKVTRLKTLKDLPRLVVWSRKDDFVSDIVSESDAICSKRLKAEAVKWIKEDLYHFKRDGLTTTTQLRMVKQWMKRFNLTEEDLKCQ